MDMELLPLLALLGLGALHGVNPGMGWLFAVALGLQEGRGRAVWRALPPLALGHALAIAAAVAMAAVIGVVIPMAAVRWGVGVLLLGVGVFRFYRHAHPRYGGMRMNGRELTAWSFLMATAHGAGLMVIPLVLRQAPAHAHAMAGHAAHAAPLAAGMPAGIVTTFVHTAGYLAVTALLAALVYERLGVRVLRKAWINLDAVWAGTLVLTGLATLLL